MKEHKFITNEWKKGLTDAMVEYKNTREDTLKKQKKLKKNFQFIGFKWINYVYK